MTNATAIAQYSGSITGPQDDAEEIGVTPTITISTSHSVDSTSVMWHTMPTDSASMTVVVVEKAIADSFGTGPWDALGAIGTYSIPTPVTLEFQIDSALHPDTEYLAVVKGLRVLDATQNPHSIDVDTISFRTVRRPHHLVDASHVNGSELCPGDTIRLYFNRKLDSTATASGPLVELQRVVVTDAERWGDSTINSAVSVWLSSDSLTALLRPASSSPLVLGEPYRLLVHVGRLSGDTLDDRQIPMMVKERSVIVINAVDASDTSAISGANHMFPDTAATSFATGDSVKMRAAWINGYAFSHWRCDDVAAIDSVTSSTVSWVKSCGDVFISAVYNRLGYDSLTVQEADTGGYTQVYSSGLDSLGRHATYGVRTDDEITLVAHPSPGFKFAEWSSSIPALDGETDIAIRINPDWGWVVPTFEEDEEPAGPYLFCGVILESVPNVATLNVTCHNTDEPETRSITCSITNPTGSGACYRIMGRIDPDGTLHDWTANPRTQDTYTTTTDDSPVPTVQWFVDPFWYELSVGIEDEDGGPVPNGARVDIAPNKSEYVCGESVTMTAVDDPSHGVAFKEWQPGGSTNKVLAITMTEDKNYTAVFEESFAVVSYTWHVGPSENETAFDPSQTALDVQLLTMNPVNSTYLTVEFNQPVNTATVVASTFWVEEVGERIDGQQLQRYQTANANFVSWYNNDTKLKISLHDKNSGLSVRKMQVLNVHATSGIRSASGVYLDETGTHVAHMEAPDVRWEMQAWVTWDTDKTGEGEIFGMFNAARYTREKIVYQWKAEMPGSGGTEDIDAEPTTQVTFTDNHGFLAPSVSDGDVLEMGVYIMDDDNSDVLNQVGTIVTAVSAVIGAIPASVLATTTTLAIAAKLGSQIGPLIANSNLINDEDDVVTYNNFRGNQLNHWGRKLTDLERWYQYGGIKLVVTLE